MALGRRTKARQLELFVAASEIAALDAPYYCVMDRLLEDHGFDEFA